MITGSLIFDGVDLRSTYGAYIADGGCVDVPCFPGLKSPDINDWYEYDGIEADLSSPCVESQEITVDMRMAGSLEDLDAFVSFVKGKRFRTVGFPDLSRTIKLRIGSVRKSGIDYGLYRIEIKMFNDSPRDGLSYVQQTSASRQSGVLVDGVDLGAYGIILTGSVDGLFPESEVKENLLNESNHHDGEIHSEIDSKVACDHDDLSFSCVMRSSDVDDFWNKRDALFLDLIKPGEREIAYNGRNVLGYYKDCRPRYFSYYGRMWWEFELTFGYIGE